MSSSNPDPRTVKADAKEQRAREAKRAMKEYQAQSAAVLANTARLRELRLAREGAEVPEKKATARARKR